MAGSAAAPMRHPPVLVLGDAFCGSSRILLSARYAELSGLFEDEAARLRSTEAVESEDMHAQIQQLLRMFNDGAQSPGVLSPDLQQGAFAADLDKTLREFGLAQVSVARQWAGPSRAGDQLQLAGDASRWTKVWKPKVNGGNSPSKTCLWWTIQELEAGAPPEKIKLNGAHVGWLKLKAALRWGIFIRKRAAERRAQMEGTTDEAA